MGGGGGVLERIPSVREVWMFTGVTHFWKKKIGKEIKIKLIYANL